MAEFFARGHVDGALDRIRGGLRERRDALLAALGEHLPEAAWTRPEGGYFLWLDLPRTLDAAMLLERAAARGVTFVRGADFGGPAWSARLAFSGVPPGDVYAGLVRLAEVARPLPRRRLRAA